MRGMQTARKAGGGTSRDGCGSAHDWKRCSAPHHILVAHMIVQSGHRRAPIGSDALAPLYILVAHMIVHNRGIVMPRLGAMLLYEHKRKSPETSELVSGLFRLCSCTIMRATRFELATFWSVARRSIQLSYARIALFSNASVILQKRRANVKHQFKIFYT